MLSYNLFERVIIQSVAAIHHAIYLTLANPLTIVFAGEIVFLWIHRVLLRTYMALWRLIREPSCERASENNRRTQSLCSKRPGGWKRLLTLLRLSIFCKRASGSLQRKSSNFDIPSHSKKSVCLACVPSHTYIEAQRETTKYTRVTKRNRRSRGPPKFGGVILTSAYHALQKQSSGCAITRPIKSIRRNLSTKKEHSRVKPCETNKKAFLRVYYKTPVKLHICASEIK